MERNEEAPYALFELDLEDDEDEEEQLSSSEIHNTVEEESAARETVAWRTALSMFRVIIACKQPRLMKWQGRDICLITLDLTFAVELGGIARYHDALLEVIFTSAEAATIDPNGPQPPSAAANRPDVLAWAPELYYGIETVEPRDRNWGLNASIGDTLNIAQAGGNYGDQRHREVEFRQSIHGFKEQTRAATIVRWTMGENASRKSGIYESFSVSAAVAYHPGQTFAFKVNARFKTFVPFWKPICGKRDAPVFVDPEKLAPGSEIIDHSQLCKSTRLEKYGGRFVQ